MKILIAGEGGQGVQTVAKILAQSAFTEGQEVTYIPNFGVEQRGGLSIAFVIIDSKPIAYPKFKTADVLAILTEKAMSRVKNYQGKQTKILKNSSNLALLEELVKETKIIKLTTLKMITEKILGNKLKK
ncbi:hypothetical protein A2Z41_01080 [Microgenomates group bacterium RBG_19FT_COMBO_39_10]|nr:MAG: hypothetical protein A2Z41_01080 [Microgenomates group bacterium RBG_19FT_COMBO_39_10]